MKNLIGMNLGRYHILEQLGEGGMASVYKAYDTNLERDVAIKVIRTDQFPPAMLDQVLKRFEREAKVLAKLTHPNIVPVIDYGEFKGSPYLVMPFLPGGTLKSAVTKPMPWQQAVKLLHPIAHALAYAHEHNIVHRDIKPSNILLTDKGLPLLSDFGIARILESDQATALTTTGMGVGTPEYMAPEQWVGQAGPLSDLYSLGVVLYELVTGRKPYTADTPAAIMLKQATDPLPSPRQFVTDLPDDLEKVLIKALAKRPEDRYQSMQEFDAALERLAGDQTMAAMGTLQTTDRQAEVATLLAEGTGQPSFQVAHGVPALPETGQQPGKWGRWAIIGGILLVACILLSVLGIGALNSRQRSRLQTPSPVLALVDTPSTSTPVEAASTDQAQASTATETPLSLKPSSVSPRDGMQMVRVPSGNFLIGVTQADLNSLFSMCPACKPGLFDDAPQRSITLSEFWIDKTEVTLKQFTLFANDTRYITDAEKRGSSLVFDSTINDFQRVKSVDWRHPQGRPINLELDGLVPVVQVSWNDARAYCEWAGRRLPTEAEWEKAARGTQGFLFPWGNERPNNTLVNYGRTLGSAVQVGSYPNGISPYGALDMAGNVWEWTGSYYSFKYYNTMPDRDPPGPPSGDERVFRGGSWAAAERDELILLSSAFRVSDPPTFSSDLLGFRCAQDANP